MIPCCGGEARATGHACCRECVLSAMECIILYLTTSCRVGPRNTALFGSRLGETRREEATRLDVESCSTKCCYVALNAGARFPNSLKMLQGHQICSNRTPSATVSDSRWRNHVVALLA